MTIQIHHVGIEKVQALPKDVSWVEGLPNNNAKLNEFNSLKLHYISLRDLMESSTTKRGGSPQTKELEWCDPSQVKFKDELLKQAARAYLQPTGKKTIPKAHFFENCWKSFTAKNKSLMETVKEYVWDCTKACSNFVRAQVFTIIQKFTPHRLTLLRMRSRQSS